MIYIDTSVVLAQLLAEDRIPKAEFWQGALVSSRLLVFEAWNRVNCRGAGAGFQVIVLDTSALSKSDRRLEDPVRHDPARQRDDESRARLEKQVVQDVDGVVLTTPTIGHRHRKDGG